LRGHFIADFEGDPRKTVGIEVGSPIEPSHVGISGLEFRPVDRRQVRDLRLAITRQSARNSEIQDRGIGVVKLQRSLLGVFRDFTRLTIPLRPQVIGIFAIVVVIARLECDGMIEQIESVRFVPPDLESDLLHRFIPMGVAVLQVSSREKILLGRDISFVVELPPGLGNAVSGLFAACEKGVVRKKTSQRDAGVTESG
jgi:hypothetical protein